MSLKNADLSTRIQSFLRGRYCPYLVLLGIFLFQVLLSTYYILADTRVLAWDQSLHLTLSLQYSKLLGAGKLLEIIGLSGYYPPFYHLSTIPLYIFGISEDISTFVNFLYLAILLVSVYGIGRIFFDKKTGLLAAFLISFYPFIIRYQRDYMPELALISLFSLSLFFLLKSEDFHNRTYSVLFGAALACSLLIKWSAIIFLIVPMVYFLVNNVRKCAVCGASSIEIRQGLRGFCSKKHMEKFNKSDIHKTVHPALNFCIAIVVACVIAGIWYLPNFNEVMENLLFFSGARTSQPGLLETDPSVFSFQSLTYYSSAVYTQISLFFVILLAIGIIFLLLDKSMRERAAFFILSILFPYLFFTLVRNKDPRYTAPLLVFFAVISAFWVFRIDKRFQNIIVAVIAIVCVIQVSALTFGVPAFNSTLLPSQAPADENWMVPDAIFAVRNSLPASANHRIIVVVLPDHPCVNGRTYEYYAELNHAPFAVYNGAYIPLDSFEKYLPSLDYIIYKEGGTSASGPYEQTVVELYRLFEERKDNFEAIGEFPLPDNSKLIVFKNHNL